MTVEAGDISLDEAADHALARMGLTYEQHLDVLVFDCVNGHLDCASRTGGRCFGEEIAKSAGIIARQRNAEEAVSRQHIGGQP